MNNDNLLRISASGDNVKSVYANDVQKVTNKIDWWWHSKYDTESDKSNNDIEGERLLASDGCSSIKT